jgi:OOP family OmpA-OmpF porin
MKRIVVLLILFSFSTFIFAQSKSEWLAYGDAAFKNEDYNSAANFYLKSIDKATPSNIVRPYETKPYTASKKKNAADSSKTTLSADPKMQYVIHQIAESYRLNHDYNNAEIWFQKSIANKPAQYPYENYWYGDALMKNKKYSQAKFQLETAMNAAEKTNPQIFKQAQQKIDGCFLAIDSSNLKKGTVVIELDSVINEGTSSFALNYYGDASTIQFTTCREGNVIEDPKKQNAQYTSDIYTLHKTDKGWAQKKAVEGPVNTEKNEGAGFLTLDRSNYFFTRWSATNKNECAIYLLKQLNDKWLVPEHMDENVNMEGYKSMQPALSPDGSILYFSSNRPGGIGKMDIWYVNLNDNGKPTGLPINMGPMFNTAEDEVTPFFHYYTSTLYFSSNGLPGAGGLDVFKSSYNPDEASWSAPKNLGEPINSSKDDSYFVMERSQRQGFITSDRKECNDCKAGACYKIYSIDKEPNVYDIHGVAYNSETNQVIPNALLTFKDIRGDREPFYFLTDADGKYFLTLDEGLELYIKGQKNKFFGDAGNITTKGLSESQHFEKDFFLSPIPVGEIVIPGIEYDYDKATLRTASKKVLDDLVDFLKLNNNLSVEIGSHADDRANDKYNLNLSQERAKTCVNYLISKGIAADRLIAQGYGATKLLVEHAQTEEDHQKNRRTAFRLIKEGNIKNTK